MNTDALAPSDVLSLVVEPPRGLTAALEPTTVRWLAAADRMALARLLSVDSPFDDEDRQVALELIDAAIGDLSRGALDPTRSGYEVLVATHAGDVVGYICFGPTPMTLGTYDLYWVATAGEARGKGVARSLVRAMEAQLRLRSARLVRVETSRLEAYGAARAFYSRIGYPIAAELRDFYRPGEDLIVYVKVL